MSTIITAVAVLVFIGLIVGLLMFVHERDKKKEAIKKIEASGNKEIM